MSTPINHGLVEFRSSPIHGHGGFAAQHVLPGTRLIEYLGERIDKAEAHIRCEAGNPFIFYIDEESDIDGNVEWNPARWFNHSCTPNCEAESDDGRIWIVALRELATGEEITFNYGYDLADYRAAPCRCGTPACVGFIVAEEHFDQVRLENPARACAQ
ncbi:MAG: SET domain-containing protein-lysine N-methyltransferase [Verrucomicrobia bacterium]|nr:SET domain-containing protein-lysine N-methyltransferase [Verrucomicrobiota bacterium]